jgi:hypothetical protein
MHESEKSTIIDKKEINMDNKKTILFQVFYNDALRKSAITKFLNIRIN